MVVFGQKWLYLDKSGCSLVNSFNFGKVGYIRTNWLYSSRVVVFGQSGITRSKWLYSGKVAVFWKKLLYTGNFVVLGQNWFQFGI